MHKVSRLREKVLELQILFHELEGDVLLTVWAEVIRIRSDVGSVNQTNELDSGEVLLASLWAAFTIDIGLSSIGTHFENGDFSLDDIP